ncbi:MAG: flavodoxin family protein, partial [Thermotogaceae bacterium]|nr:flavodoxin family protein [Thermotogaceae bacterium]
MKIGIIAYSKTGNTLYVAEKLRDKLISEGKE